MNRYWLGANDRQAEGQWVWVDGTPLIFSKWAPGEPNDFNGVQDCSYAGRFDRLWDDVGCEIKQVGGISMGVRLVLHGSLPTSNNTVQVLL